MTSTPFAGTPADRRSPEGSLQTPTPAEPTGRPPPGGRCHGTTKSRDGARPSAMRVVRPGGATASLRNSSDTFRKMSFASLSPTVTRTLLAREGRTTTPGLLAGGREGDVRSPSRSQTKLAWVSGTVQPCPRSASTTRVRSHTSARDPADQLVLRAQRGDRRLLRDLADPEGHRRLAQRRRHRLVGDREADPQARQAVRLGEGAQDADVGPLAVERPTPSGTSASRMNSR